MREVAVCAIEAHWLHKIFSLGNGEVLSVVLHVDGMRCDTKIGTESMLHYSLTVCAGRRR